MRKAFKNLSSYYKTAVIILILLLLFSLGGMAMYFSSLSREILLGIIAGLLVSLLVMVISGFINRNEKESFSYKRSIVTIILRFVIFAVFIIVLALLYYNYNIRAINVISSAIAYLVTVIIFIIVLAREKNGEQ